MNDGRATTSTPAGIYLGPQKQPTLLVEWMALLWLFYGLESVPKSF